MSIRVSFAEFRTGSALVSIALMLLALQPALGVAQEAQVVRVSPGESIQKAIDAAPEGAVIELREGVYPGAVMITKPMTLQGAGWDKTVLIPGSAIRAQEEKLKFVDALEAAPSFEERARLMIAYFGENQPTITVKSAKDVTLRGVMVHGRAPTNVDGLLNVALIHFDDAEARVVDCACVGPFWNGIAVTNGSDVEVMNTLIAALWGTGVRVHPGEQKGARPARAHLVESDIRNCYYAGATIRGEGTVIERCRISGAAWHGVRYDDCSPTLSDNWIYGNARCGIYASGNTTAVVRSNVFWRNEMNGVACWYNNMDTIAGNTFVNNLREGIGVIGGAKPTLSHNIIFGSPIGIACFEVADKNGQGVGAPQPDIIQNVFWKTPTPVKRLLEEEPVPDGNLEADPKFVDEAKHDFGLAQDSPARQIQSGVASPISFQSPWGIQPEELSIIPDGDTRDFNKWKKPSSNR